MYFENSFAKEKRDGIHAFKKEKKITKFCEIKFVIMDAYIIIMGIYNKIKFKSI